MNKIGQNSNPLIYKLFITRSFMKIKDLFNKTINSNNNQVSFNLKKREARKNNIDIDEILNTEIKCERLRFK